MALNTLIIEIRETKNEYKRFILYERQENTPCLKCPRFHGTSKMHSTRNLHHIFQPKQALPGEIFQLGFRTAILTTSD